MRGSRLVIPACLAVSTVQLGCPSDTSPSGTSTTGGASTSTTDPDTTTSTSTTASTSTTSDTTTDVGDTTLASSESSATSTSASTDTGSESGADTGSGLPDCNAIEDPKTCNAMPGCLYDVVVGQCDVDCTLIRDMAICVDQTGVCYWQDGACSHVTI